MSDDEIISSMVKGRECCRRLIQIYEGIRAKASSGEARSPDVGVLRKAEDSVTRMLMYFKSLPQMPGSSLKNESKKEYAARLLKEIGDLLQKAMILERESRTSEGRRKGKSSCNARALRAYASV